MDLYKEILIKIIEKEKIKITFENFDINTSEIVELRCYQALQKIKTIIEDDIFNDDECFMRIEKIVKLFEGLGSDGGVCHDFG